jgi:signal transduction histidine kinase
MIATDLVHDKAASSPDAGGAVSLNQPAPQLNPARQISPAVAHDLNNLLTVMQVYSEKLVRQGQHPELQPQLTSIWEAAKRAATVVREASPKK